MRKLLLNHTPLFRKLRQLSLLLTLLLALPLSAWGQDDYSKVISIDSSDEGIWILSTNASDILGNLDGDDATMSYDAENNILTLNGINLSCSGDNVGQTWSSFISCVDYNNNLNHLIVKLVGQNVLQVDAWGRFFNGTSLKFITDDNNPGSLTIYTPNGWNGNMFVDYSDPISPTYENELSLTKNGNTYTIKTPSTGYISYGITIADTPVTSENKDNVLGNGTVSFTPAAGSNPTNTLTLRGAEIGSTTTSFEHGITVTNLANLTIICAGEAGYYSYSDVYSTGTPIYCNDASCDLTFTSEEKNINYIQFNTNATSLVEGFKSVTYVENKAEQFLPQKQIGFITYKINFNHTDNGGAPSLNTKTRTFDTTHLNSANHNVLSGGGFTFDPATCTLTIQDGTKFGRLANEQLQQSAIYTEIQWGVNADLTVVINGDCQIIGGVDGTLTYYPFRNFDMDNMSVNNGVNTGVKISFEKGTGVTNANLALVGVGNTKANLFRDFAESDIILSGGLDWVSGLPVENSASITASYDITVETTPVTVAAGKAGITPGSGSGKVYYDGASNIMTLDGVNLNGPIATNINNMIIELKGENKINAAADNAIKRISSNETLNLTIRPADSDPLGSINLANSSSNLIDGFNVSLGGTLFAYPALSGSHDSYITSLLVGSQMVTHTGDVFSSNSKVTFDNTSNTNVLTLSGVTDDLKYSKIISGLSNLTINFNGANTIVREDTATVIMSTNGNSVLTFTKATDASTLTISNVTGEHSIIHGFKSITYGDGIYQATPAPTTYINTPNKGLMSASDNTKPINSLSLSSNPSYQLWVAGNQVTGANVTGTNIAGTVTFNATNNTLTLSGANIIGSIESSVGDLNIHLTGGNTIKAAGTGTSVINSTNAGTVTFETDATTGNQLSFLKSDGGYFDAIPINGFTVAYEAGLGYNSQFSEIIESLTIEYNDNTYKLHSSNANNIVGDGKVSYSYDSTNGSVLTLNNGNVGYIEWKISDNLTIAINGTCSVSNTGHYYAINSNGNGDVSFVKASGASNAELTLKWGSGNDPVAAPNSTLGSGLYWKPIAATQRIITDNPEFVIVGDYAIPDGTPVNGTTSGTITYNATDKLLTISSFSQTFAQDAIKTSVSGLKVKLVGESTITCNNGGSAFTASTTSASIQFVKNDANSKLTMVTSLGPLSNFANGAITYDELYYYYAGNDNYIIKPKNSPTIKFVKRNQADGSIPTTQSAYEYVAENSTIPLTYGTDFYAPKPVFSDDYQLSDSTRYVYSMSVDGVVEFVLGGTDYHNSDKILYADNGKLNILKSGELTITCSFPGNDENEPCSASYTLKITRVFNNPFATTPAEQIYATYYNFNEDLALPDGIVAYIVTGVSGNTVTTTATGYLPQNTAVLLEKTGDVGPTVTGYTGSAGDFTGNLLRYIVSADPSSQTPGVPTTGKEYVLYKNEFVRATNTIPTNSCYLDLNGVSFTRGAYGIGDGSTAIKTLQLDAIENETWFDLQGRRIDKPTRPGLYIKNGKKVVVNNK